MRLSTEKVPATGTPISASLQIGNLRGIDQVQAAKQEVRLLIEAGYRTIHLDLGAVRGVSSDVINFLVWCQMECSRNGVNLQVDNVTPEALRVFRFTGLNQVVDLHPAA